MKTLAKDQFLKKLEYGTTYAVLIDAPNNCRQTTSVEMDGLLEDEISESEDFQEYEPREIPMTYNALADELESFFLASNQDFYDELKAAINAQDFTILHYRNGGNDVYILNY